jgi:hypothetical protein
MPILFPTHIFLLHLNQVMCNIFLNYGLRDKKFYYLYFKKEESLNEENLPIGFDFKR